MGERRAGRRRRHVDGDQQLALLERGLVRPADELLDRDAPRSGAPPRRMLTEPPAAIR